MKVDMNNKTGARQRAELWGLFLLMMLLFCGGFAFLFLGGLDHFVAGGMSLMCFALAVPTFNTWYARWTASGDVTHE